MTTKSIVITVLAIIVVLGAWFWGANGRWTAERALQRAELRQNLMEGRSNVLEARLDVYSVNFGEASRHLENARALLGRASDQLTHLDRASDATAVQAALAGIDDAQRMAGNLDQNANTRAADVAKIIAGVLESTVKTPDAK